MSKQIIFDKIFTLPTVTVNQAYKKYISDHMAVSKAQAAERLADLVVAGKISIDDCIGQATAPSAHDTAKVDAAAQAASRAESVARDAL